MQLLGGDAHLAAQPELSAIGKAGGTVYIHGSTVHSCGEPVGVGLCPGQDGFAVAGGVSSDVGNGLVHSAIAAEFLPKLAQRLGPDRTAKGLHPVELRLDERAAALIPGTPAGPKDFDTEFLDYILAVKIVDSVEEAIAHIAAHSTGHSEAILTRTDAHAALFTAAVDSAAVYVNCSTRFTDGGEFGLGCEMGISTQKLHARGPMGLGELCSYKYIIHGNGQTR